MCIPHLFEMFSHFFNRSLYVVATHVALVSRQFLPPSHMVNRDGISLHNELSDFFTAAEKPEPQISLAK